MLLQLSARMDVSTVNVRHLVNADVTQDTAARTAHPVRSILLSTQNTLYPLSIFRLQRAATRNSLTNNEPPQKMFKKFGYSNHPLRTIKG